MNAPGTWHDSNPNERVDFAVARAAWADAMLPELEHVAKHLYGTITYQDLAEAVQTRTGYRTKMLLSNWIGKTLDVVIERAQTQRLPPLTSLVVHKTTGGVGDGYYNSDHPHGTLSGHQLQHVAAEDRLACYRAYCPDVPADARPRMTAHYDQIRSRQRKATLTPQPQPAVRPQPVCPNCFTTLPRIGFCACGWKPAQA